MPLSGVSPGLYNLTLLNIDGLSGTKVNAFRVNQIGTDPTIVNFSPKTGVNTASLPFTINGTNFQTGATVTISNGSVNKTIVPSSVTQTQIKCSLPLTGLPVGLYNLTIRNVDGSNGTLQDAFPVTYKIPTITTISPLSGYNTSTVTISVSGTNFYTGCLVTLVNGSNTILGTVSSFTTAKLGVSCNLSGFQEGFYNLTVTNPGGPPVTKLNVFNILAPRTDPIIDNFSPKFGINNGSVSCLINGTNFRPGATVIITNGTTNKSFTPTTLSTTQIKCTFPLTGLPIGLYNLSVRNSDGSNGTGLEVFTVLNPTPTITSFTPVSGYNNSPVSVTINGKNYVSGCTVSLINQSSTIPGIITSFATTKIVSTFSLPGFEALLYNVTVINPGGPNATVLNGFNVIAPTSDPVLTNFSPVTGPNTGSLPFIINGSNFRPSATVTITNGSTTKIITPTSVSPIQIRCTLPLTGLPIGVYNLTVRNSDGSNATLLNAFTVTSKIPAITSISPTSGYNTGSIQIKIGGTDFKPGCTVRMVNGTTEIPGPISSFTTTKFTGTFALNGSPALIYNITVTNPGGPPVTRVNAFTLNAPVSNPTITNISPLTGLNTVATQSITIDGNNFRPGAIVIIDNRTTIKTVIPTTITLSQIRCSLPLKGMPIGLYNLTVKNTDGSLVIQPNGFTVLNPTPKITSISPAFGYNTSAITISITGSSFITGCTLSLTNGSTTIPGNLTSFSAVKVSGIFTLTGASAGLYNLTVTNPGGPSATLMNGFNLSAPGSGPVITNFAPLSGQNSGPVQITINGSNFSQGAKILITNGTRVVTGTTSSVSKILIKGTLPLTGLTPGLYNLSVRNSDGSEFTHINGFEVTNVIPAITSNTPLTGYNTGQVQIKVIGKNFINGCQVALVNRTTSINGSISSLKATSFVGTFILTGAPTGLYNLTVANPAAPEVKKVNAFTIVNPGAACTITSINPAFGLNTGSLPVIITGTKFNSPTVYLNQGEMIKLAQATPGKVSTQTTMYISLPLTGVPGGYYNITVHNSDGVNTTAQDIFYVTDQTWISSPHGTSGKSGMVSRPEVSLTQKPQVSGVVGPSGRQVIVGRGTGQVGGRN